MSSIAIEKECKSLPRWFESKVHSNPDAVAVICDDEAVSYAHLNRLANRFAHQLRSRDIGPGSRVAVCLPRSPRLIAVLLGVMKSGAAYIPLDPGFPRDRLVLMVEDSTPEVVVTTESQRGLFPKVPSISIDDPDDDPFADHQRDSNLDESPAPTDLAYVIYTSGSTGRPKGVMVEHQSLLNFLACMGQRPGFAADDVIVAVTTVSFDIAALELFLPLVAGGTIVLATREEAQDPERLGALIRRSDASVLQSTPSLWQMLLDAGWEGSPHLRALCGGEALPRSLANRILERVGELWNLYGPTEATIWCSAEKITGGDHEITLGEPLEGLGLHVLDEQGEPVKGDATGELYLTGVGLARGYLGSDDLTAERFVTMAIEGKPMRAYRTGDECRMQPDGSIVFVGRLDHQVKVRGYRVELGEIEGALDEHSQVDRAVVTVRGTGAECTLEAHFCSPNGDSPTPAELRSFLSRTLPEYMVPTRFLRWDSLPQTPNGKVDRKALSRRDVNTAQTTRRTVSPRDDVERTLASLWRESLGTSDLGIHDDFFELGGQSLKAVALLSRVRDRFYVTIPVARFLEGPTIAQLAQLLRDNDGSPFIAASGTSGPQPLSAGMRRLWYLDRHESQGVVYNEPYVTSLDGTLDQDRLRAAFAAAMERFPALRARIVSAGPEGLWEELEAVETPFFVTDLTNDPENADDRSRAICVVEASHGFDLSQAPLWRAHLIRLAPERHTLVVTLHHAICDDWSLRLFFEYVQQVYGGDTPKEPDPRNWQLADFVSWESDRARNLSADLQYWRQQLEGSPRTCSLLPDRPRPSSQSLEGERTAVTLSPETSRRLRKLAQRHRTSVFNTALAAFKVFLARYGNLRDVVVGSPLTYRDRGPLQDTVGFFLNTLPLRTRLNDDDTFSSTLDRVVETVHEAHRHSDAPFDRIVEVAKPPRTTSHPPLFQVAFVLLNEPPPIVALAAFESQHVPLHTGGSKYDLTLELYEDEDEIWGVLEYDSALFESKTAARWTRQFAQLTDLLVAEPEKCVWDHSLFSDDAHESLLEWSRGPRTSPSVDQVLVDGGFVDGNLVTRFQSWVESQPEAVAVSERGLAITYAKLDAASDVVAAALLDRGIVSGDVVGLALPRSAALVRAMLGVLKAGGIYVPLDTRDPFERKHQLLEKANCRLVVVPEDGPTEARELGLPVLPLPRPSDQSAPADLPPPLSLDAAAYVLFTSGSTGEAKGVVVPHRAIVRLVVGQSYLPFDEKPCIAFLSNPGFDASTLEVWGPLLNGGRVAVHDEEISTLGDLGRFFRAHEVTAAWLTSELFNTIVDEDPMVLESLGHLLTGGEALSPGHVRRALAALPRTRILNGYGPTEATTFTTVHAIEDLDEDAHHVSIGRPLANTTTWILDERRHPVPLGVPGELYIGGDGLALGYLDEEATAERFVRVAGEDGEERLYRSGDRVRWIEGGLIEFLGRADRQVKIRGFRVEPRETEVALESLDAVDRAAVLVESSDRGHELLAYAVTSQATSEQHLKAALIERLAPQLIPSRIEIVEKMPLTANGKLDISQLRRIRARASSSPPRNELESRLLDLWKELLRTDKLGVDDDFFEAGGHSLLAVRMLTRLEEDFSYSVPIAALVRASSVADLAVYIGKGLEVSTNVFDVVPVRQVEGTTPVFFIPGLGGAAFLLPDLSSQMGHERSIYTFQANPVSGPLTMETIAESVIHGMRSVQPQGPYHVAGFSIGGSIGYEVARQLAAEGESMGMVAIIDHGPANLRWSVAAAWDALLNLPHWVREAAGRGPRRVSKAVRNKLRGLWGRARRRLTGEALTAESVVNLRAWTPDMKNVANAHYMAYRQYQPGSYPGGVVLVRARRQPLLAPLGKTLGWDALADDVSVHVIAGGHLDMIRGPGLIELARVLREELEKLDTTR